MAKIRDKWHAMRERLRFKYLPRISNWLVRASTTRTRRRLKRSGPIEILIDNTVLAHAITHETAWISTGVQKWGTHDIDTGYAARIPVHSPDDESDVYQNIRYLPGIASLAREHLIFIKTSAELAAERFRQPTGRFSGYGYFDYDLFGDITVESIDGHADQLLGPSYLNLPNATEQQRARLAKESDPAYLSLLQVLGQKSSQDAWHIWTAERHGLFCFLTMDFRLRRILDSQKGTERLKSIRTRVMTPLEFGKYFEMIPVYTNILSYNDASFPVHPGLPWPDGSGRQRRRQKAPLAGRRP